MKTGLIVDPCLARKLGLQTPSPTIYLRDGNPTLPGIFARFYEQDMAQVCLIEWGVALKNDLVINFMEQNYLGLVSDQIALFDVKVDEPSPEGVHFTDMTSPYDGELQAKMQAAFSRHGFRVEKVCIAGVRRTDLLTKSERQALSNLGADFAVQYVHQEACRARERGMRVVALIHGGIPLQSSNEDKKSWNAEFYAALHESGLF